MIFVYLFLIGIPAILIFFTIKKIIKVKAVAQRGVETRALITHISLVNSGRNSLDKLTLEYSDNTGARHAAKATTITGQYRPGDTMPLKYLTGKPSCYTIDGMEQGQWVILTVGILLLAFTIYASYKIDELVQAGNYQFNGF